jgi:hypothetical protein
MNSQVVLARLPTGKLSTDDFELRDAPAPEPGDGEVLVQTLLLSIDAANRAWMQGATYRSALAAGDVMAGLVLGRVEVSNAPGVAVGDIVEAESGWQERAVHPARAVRRVEVRRPLTNHLSVLGITGRTAWTGLFDVGRPQPGETVLVSAAAGATGNVVGQLAKRHGCRVVGVAGSAEKLRFCTEELGFDAAVSHRDEHLHRALKAACPDGVDVYFDNTGGRVLEAALSRMNLRGRIVCCGVVSQYDTDNPAPGPRGVPGLLVTKRLRMEGFVVLDDLDGAAAREGLVAALDAGELKVVEDVLDGLDRAPEALVGLLAGDNVGKRMVRVAT